MPCLQPERADDPDFLKELRILHLDVAVVVSYGQILKETFLAIPSKGCFNLHASLLPRHRGASPIAAAILAGDKETGVTLQRMVKKLDAGDIVAQWKVPIRPQDTTGDLSDLLARRGSDLLLESLPRIEAGDAVFKPQDESLATYAPKLRKESGDIDWRRTAEEVDRHVRAMNPWPGAFTHVSTDRGALRVTVLAGLPQGSGGGEPGKVLAASREGLDVGCGRGIYRIKALQPEGGRPMPARHFLNGYPTRPGTFMTT